MPNEDPPLVSPRSPSYERAREALHAPAEPDIANAIARVSALSEAELNASHICTRLAGLLRDDVQAERVRSQAETHAGRRDALAAIVDELGGSAPRPEECRTLLVLADAALERAAWGTDTLGVLEVLHDELHALYTEAAHEPGLSAAQQAKLAELADSAR